MFGVFTNSTQDTLVSVPNQMRVKRRSKLDIVTLQVGWVGGRWEGGWNVLSRPPPNKQETSHPERKGGRAGRCLRRPKEVIGTSTREGSTDKIMMLGCSFFQKVTSCCVTKERRSRECREERGVRGRVGGKGHGSSILVTDLRGTGGSRCHRLLTGRTHNTQCCDTMNANEGKENYTHTVVLGPGALP